MDYRDQENSTSAEYYLFFAYRSFLCFCVLSFYRTPFYAILVLHINAVLCLFALFAMWLGIWYDGSTNGAQVR
jgi:hypothetical protein